MESKLLIKNIKMNVEELLLRQTVMVFLTRIAPYTSAVVKLFYGTQNDDGLRIHVLKE